tara:strand:- start:5865 stop:6041 length:177 start_codon:yes stop_codon:yes gene_type:complete
MTQKPQSRRRVIHRPNSHDAEMERLEEEVRNVIQRYRKLFSLTDAELRLVFNRALRNQ